jgi:hypothetical protein
MVSANNCWHEGDRIGQRCHLSGTPRVPGDLGSCSLRARSHGDLRGTTGYNGERTDRVWERFPSSRSVTVRSFAVAGAIDHWWLPERLDCAAVPQAPQEPHVGQSGSNRCRVG